MTIEQLDIKGNDGGEEAKMVQGEFSANLRLRRNTYMPIMHATVLSRGCDPRLTVFLPPSLSSSLPDCRRVHDGPPLTVWIPTHGSYCWSRVVLDCSSL